MVTKVQSLDTERLGKDEVSQKEGEIPLARGKEIFYEQTGGGFRWWGESVEGIC